MGITIVVSEIARQLVADVKDGNISNFIDAVIEEEKDKEKLAQNGK